ncbi:isochorismate synthase [uncultured Flavobacterium sp.]|uniref:isochorismate synthase n=1 Tax=uncultured Flavobacterium sp. TaxID=165435 RepID=UPI0030EBB934
MKIFVKAKSQFKNNLPFVLFAKPNENQLNAYFQSDNELHKFINQSGFVFTSFEGLTKIVLPKENSAYFEEEIDFNLSFKSESIQIPTLNEDKIHFENLVNNSVEAIKSGNFEKLVVSRKIDFSAGIDVFQTYENLLNAYSTAFRYLFFHPKVGIWIGATPEQLIKINNDKFETVALAGTQLYSNEVHWTSKEIQEQQFVTDYIISNCEELASTIEVSESFTVQAGKLAHIKTKIFGTISKENEVALISKLHPTPAVCGLPKEKAKEFILKNEKYDRKFYAGYLGEWNINETTNLFVNLRCMEIGKKNSIYVGCGITEDSVAENEFIETQNKSETIKNIIITKA